MNPCVARLRAAVITQTRGKYGEFRSNNPDICLFRIGVQGHPDLPRVLQMAQGFRTFFEESEVDLHPDDLLVGYFNNRPGLSAASVPRKDHGITGHLAPDYAMLLSLGIDGVLAKNQTCRDHLPADDPRFAQKLEFHEAVRQILGAFKDYVQRYEALAAEQGRANLVAVCQHIAGSPPSTFQEGLNLVFLVHMIGQYLAGLLSFGRPDRYLYPLYKQSLAAGVTREEILAFIEAFYVKVEPLMNVPQSLMLAGQQADGSPANNELTDLFLDAQRELRLIQPALAVSWNSRTPVDFKLKVLDMFASGLTNPAIFNDEVVIHNLMAAGASREDAVDFCHCTCTEITPCGKSNIYVVSPYLNPVGVLLQTIAVEAALGSITSYAEFYESFQNRFAFYLDQKLRSMIHAQELRVEDFPFPFLSAFIHDCLERGEDISWGGARYNYHYPQLVGLPTLADSLSAIKQIVFDKKQLSLKALQAILQDNFAGHEELRQEILYKFPKFGNDIHSVDEIGHDFACFYYDLVSRYRGPFRNGQFLPGYLCFIMHEEFGKVTGTSPDGRLAGTPLSSSLAPALGRGQKGPTAAMNSAACLEQDRAGGSSVFNLTLNHYSLSSREKKLKVIALIDGYFQNHGYEVQVNLLNEATLRAAQQDPGAQADLMVRVGGFSAYFVTLNEALQEEIIRRLEG